MVKIVIIMGPSGRTGNRVADRHTAGNRVDVT
jgi:hypothetical protein